MASADVRPRDRLGRPRSPATFSDFHKGVAPKNKGRRYEPRPPLPEEIRKALAQTGRGPQGARLRAAIALLWRGGLSLSEALALDVGDLNPPGGRVYVRGRHAREVQLDYQDKRYLTEWNAIRRELPGDAYLCVIKNPGKGSRWSPDGLRAGLARAGRAAGLSRLAPMQLRQARAIELWDEGLAPIEVQGYFGLSQNRGNSNWILGTIRPSRPAKDAEALADRVRSTRVDRLERENALLRKENAALRAEVYRQEARAKVPEGA